jgi:DNA-directed RNA polymerase specialized sigma24 family protein
MPLTLNEKQAADFLDSVAKDMKKHRETLRIRLVELGVDNAHDSDDILQETIVNVYGTILKNGLSEGEHYQTYFDKSLKRDVMKFKTKRDKKRFDTVSLDYLVEEEGNSGEDPTSYFRSENISSVQAHGQNGTTWEEEDEEVRNHPFQTTIPGQEEYGFTPEAKRKHMDAILMTFRSLPTKYQQVLLLEAEGLQYKQMCRALNLTIGQVRMRLNSARKMIKAIHNPTPDKE